MARLTDSQGTLLGGLNTALDRLSGPHAQPPTTTLRAPAAAPLTPEYEPGEIVFALSCSYGSLAHLGFSAAPAGMFADGPTRARGCDNLVEMPEERHFCPACGGYYCTAHADPVAHDCQSVMRVI